MEKEQKTKVSPLTLFKSRGYNGCIADAYRLFTDNFSSILRHLWLPLLLFSAFIAAAVVVSFQGSSLQMQGIATGDTAMLQKGSIFILASVALILIALVPMNIMYGRFFTMLRQHSLTDKMPLKKEKLPKAETRRSVRRTWIAMIAFGIAAILLVIIALAPLLYGYNGIPFDPSNYKWYGIAAFLAIVCFVFFLPLYNVYESYVIDHNKGLFATLATQYGKSFRHWGFLFALFVITVLILAIIMGILALPMLVLSTADNINTIGMAQGDPDGLPASFPLLIAITTLLVTFASYCIYLVVYTIMYYAYGSIETSEKERAARKSIEN